VHPSLGRFLPLLELTGCPLDASVVQIGLPVVSGSRSIFFRSGGLSLLQRRPFSSSFSAFLSFFFLLVFFRLCFFTLLYCAPPLPLSSTSGRSIRALILVSQRCVCVSPLHVCPFLAWFLPQIAPSLCSSLTSSSTHAFHSPYPGRHETSCLCLCWFVIMSANLVPC